MTPGSKSSSPSASFTFSTHRGPLTRQSLLRALNAANEVFKAGGVQFALRSIERYHMPNFADLRQASPCGGGGEVDRTWANVRAELQAVFPGTPQNAWIDSTPKTNRLWLTSVETLYGKPEEMVVWLSALTSCGNGFWSAFPWSGRNLVLNGPAIAGEPYKLAHELGHYFGLVHSFNMDTARDPETNTPHVMSDRFDLVYKRGTSAQNPHAFYSSKEAAAANEASLRLIEEYNCTTPADGGAPSCASPCSWNGGTISCTIGDPAGYTEVHNLGSAALKGLGFTFASGIGFNVMSYAGPFGEGASRAFGHSDVQLVRRFLRWDLQLDQAEADLIKPNTVMSGRRPRLGAWDLRGADAKIDFDADGRRDFGVWTPPTDMVSFGSFRVLLSSQAYSVSAGQSISVQFGRLGDVPVVADYNGDGRTDVGVFQPGGGVNRDNPLDTSGIWRWCTTASTPASTTCGHEGAWPGPIAFGLRDAVPQPGLDFDGTTNGELAYYRPATGEWTWQTIGVGQQSRQLGTAGSVPLPGLYDGDSKTDIAIYDPYSAEFKLLRSEQSWNTVTTRAFDSKFIPLPNGTGQDRGICQHA